MEQRFEPIPEEFSREYATLRKTLMAIAAERGADFHVEEWRISLFATPFDQRTLTMGETYQWHGFAGYKIEEGQGLPEDNWRRSVLLADFDPPERHRLPRPEGAGPDYRILAVSVDKDKFDRRALEERLQQALPNFDLHLDEH